jgi:hypothetical protein
MESKLRVEFPGAIHHVMNRGDLYRLSSLVRAEIRKVRLEPELVEADPPAGAAQPGN